MSATMSAREIECAEEWLAAALDDEPDQETVEYWRDEGLKAKTIRLFAEPVRFDPPKRRKKP